MSINSSVNFLIYCIFGNKFKTIFMQIFCGQKPRVQTVRTGLEYRRSQMDGNNSFSCRAAVIDARRNKSSDLLLGGGSSNGGGGVIGGASDGGSSSSGAVGLRRNHSSAAAIYRNGVVIAKENSSGGSGNGGGGGLHPSSAAATSGPACNGGSLSPQTHTDGSIHDNENSIVTITSETYLELAEMKDANGGGGGGGGCVSPAPDVVLSSTGGRGFQGGHQNQGRVKTAVACNRRML